MEHLKYTLCGAVFLAGLAVAGSARANYVGDTIAGTLAFGPNGSFGGQFWNPSTIVASESFFYSDAANNDTAAHITGSTLIIRDQVKGTANGWQMTFTDLTTPFLGLARSRSASAIVASTGRRRPNEKPRWLLAVHHIGSFDFFTAGGCTVPTMA